MEFLGRSRELGRLRGALDERSPHVVLVTGLRGGGKTELVHRVLTDYPAIRHVCPPLPDPEQRRALLHRLASGATDEGHDPPPADAGWDEILDHIVERAGRRERPFVLVLDDAHRLAEARSRYASALHAALEDATRRGISFHVVLVGPHGGLPLDELGGIGDEEGRSDRHSETGTTARGIPALRLRLGPLPFRSAAPRLPGRRPHEKIRAYGVFGGIPRVLAMLDDQVTVGTNVRRLLLSPEGPLADAGNRWLELDLQAPSRYYAIMRTLALGEAEWATVHGGVSDLTRSGQVAPYLKRLEELGLAEARRSLDASPRGRSRRYTLTDPFLAFFFRFVLSRRWEDPGIEDTVAEGDTYARLIRPKIDDHLRTVFPLVCRQHMEHDAIETLGHNAREGGSLWGPGYDLPVAGILTSGAVYYGTCLWNLDDVDAPFASVDDAVRETRFGFGRERRLRLVFTGRPPGTSLRREAARRRDRELIDAEALSG